MAGGGTVRLHRDPLALHPFLHCSSDYSDLQLVSKEGDVVLAHLWRLAPLGLSNLAPLPASGGQVTVLLASESRRTVEALVELLYTGRCSLQGTSALEVLEGLASLGILLTGALEERQVRQDVTAKEQEQAATPELGVCQAVTPPDVKHQLQGVTPSPQAVTPYEETPRCVRGVAPVPRDIVKQIRKQSEVRHWLLHRRLPVCHDDGLGSDSSAGRDSLEEEEEECEEGEEGEDWEYSEGTREEFLRRFVTKRMDLDYIMEEVGGDEEAMVTSSDEVVETFEDIKLIGAEDEVVEDFGSDEVKVMQVDDNVKEKVDDEVMDIDDEVDEVKRKEDSRKICYIRVQRRASVPKSGVIHDVVAGVRLVVVAARRDFYWTLGFQATGARVRFVADGEVEEMKDC